MTKPSGINPKINQHIRLEVESAMCGRAIWFFNDFYKQVGISQSAWSRFCRGKQDLKFQQILHICEYLRIDVARMVAEIQLLDGEGYE